MKKLLAVLLIFGLLFSFTACKSNVTSKISSQSSIAPYKVIDSREKEVSFTKTPSKIISLIPSDTEILYALGIGDKLIAVSNYCNYPSDANNKTKLDRGKKTNIEAIIGLNPDIVIMGKMAQTEDQFKQLEDAGIKVFVTDANNINDTYNIISMLGNVFKLEQKASEINIGMKKEFENIKEQIKNKPVYKVYIEIYPLANGPWSCGKGTFQDELLTLVGAKNIFDDINDWQKVSEEEVINRNPDIIFTTDMNSNLDPLAEILSRKNWANINALKNNRVFLADADKLTRPGPRLVEAAKELVAKIYG